MVGIIPRLPRKAWKTTFGWTFGITAITVAVTMLTVIGVVLPVYGELNPVILATAIMLPLGMTPPVVGYMCIHHQQLKLANEKLQELAYKDSLVGCMNRRGFTASVDIALQYATSHRPCALMIIDADNFKQVNDTFGHDRGDEALLLITRAIKSAIRSADLLGRIGGEEFGVFLPSTDEAQTETIARRICDAVEAIPFAPDGENHRLSVSIGGAIATEATTFTTLFKNADKRLYVAKQTGRARADLTILAPDSASTAA